MKLLLEAFKLLDLVIINPLGWFTAIMLMLSLYPPWSFIPKFFVLFALTH